MLSGTDLSFAYTQFDQSKQQGFETVTPVKGSDKVVDVRKEEPVKQAPVVDPGFMTADQKLFLLTSQLAKQKELFEQQKGTSYLDKLVAKRKEVLKLVLFSFVILLALSTHSLVKHYLKVYFAEVVLTPTKEFALRLMYPTIVLLLLWNIKVFNK
jgi:hypothetical protein